MNTKSEITEELKLKIIEAYIFASKDPVHISKLQFFENDKSNLLKIIKKLQNKYITSGINLINIENGKRTAINFTSNILNRMGISLTRANQLVKKCGI